ncbi:hypothetical protein [Ornithinimicrobium faecis]|uniref:hypothetical protein n=1 Tax=Ornithinimicrobium faecis TaxID=2934158 RepID=UPI002117FB98|nr:hypothetical protein [Ornithinimicrobium sp. HY1745]
MRTLPEPAVPPERISRPLGILLHPDEDGWTAPELSESFLSRLAAPTRSVRLAGCGHFPVEEPGFQQLLDEVAVELASLESAA